MSELIKFLNLYETVEEKITQLKEQFAITASNDPVLPDLYSLNYSQLDSPKTSPIVRECRSIIVNLSTNEIVARSFDRFYNYGEAQNVVDVDLSNAVAREKIDGSIFLFYNTGGVWYPASRKTTTARNSMMKVNDKPLPMLEIVRDFYDIEHEWVLEEPEGLKGTWIEEYNYFEFVYKLQDVFGSQRWGSLTYVVELVSPYNMVISEYKKCDIYFLGATNKDGETSYDPDLGANFNFPEEVTVSSMEEVQDFISSLQKKRNYFVEGVVVTDQNGNKAKIKTNAYVAAHLAGGENPTHNSIVKVVSTYEEDEYLTYFPEHKSVLQPYIDKRKQLIDGIRTALNIAASMKNEGKTNKDISLELKANFQVAMPFVMKALNTGDYEITTKTIEKHLK